MSQGRDNARAALRARLQPLQARWATLADREKLMVSVMLVALAVLLVWLVAIRPAWRTWRDVPAQAATLEAEWLQMQRMAAEAKELKGQAPVSATQAAEALKAATERLGAHGTLAVLGDRATLTMKSLPQEQFRAWLSEARLGARARPTELQVTRAEDGLNGRLVVQLPGTP